MAFQMSDHQNPKSKLCDFFALAPEPPISAYLHGAGVRVARSSKLPSGWVGLRLSLDPGTLRKVSGSALIVAEGKAVPKPAPEGRGSDGSHLQVIRRMVNAWLRASDAPKSERAAIATARVTEYMDAAEFATGDRNGWPMPMSVGRGYASICHLPHSPAAFIEAIQGKALSDPATGRCDRRRGRVGVPQVHKKHNQRADVYWVLETDRGHVMHIKTGGAVSDTIKRDGAPALPAGWSLQKTVMVSTGMRGSVLARFRKIRSDLDRDASIPFDDRMKIRAIEDFIRHARKTRSTNGG